MRNINWDAPLTKEDLMWLGQRMTPELEAKIAANRALVAKKDDGGSKTPEFNDEYDKMKVAELKAEAEGREPAIDLTGVTTKPDLIAALRTWDSAYPDAEEV